MLSIGEVSTISGLRPSALRYYEEAGLIAPVARISGRRHYEVSVLNRLRVIACACVALGECTTVLARPPRKK
jgi:DNA-binding transcriptional MerR regulator